ncbi:hypothetical protein [Desulfoscipio gibsoniae]|uniref:Uncharacterized protein n=1 Tax=Desulfoscipio gibsoniae DSM 7213 TaxID=767817 RepID=R4KQ40_9FIRM|nr:hypothetical protein [Desulfoscipio gibsoniae]AGL02690.1 hypothetical protein Desgi_3345 [Desulfoscipio gibsoniae DSM 7213]
MQNARALDERLRKIIKAISDSTGQEIKRDLIEDLACLINEQRTKEIHGLLQSFNRAIKRI